MVFPVRMLHWNESSGLSGATTIVTLSSARHTGQKDVGEALPLDADTEADTPPPVGSDPAPVLGTLWAHTEHTPVRAWDGAAHHRHPHPPTPWWFLEGAEAAPATASPSPLSADEGPGTAGMWPPSPPGPGALASAPPMTQVLGFPLE